GLEITSAAGSHSLTPHPSLPPAGAHAPAKRPTLDALLRLVRGYNPNIDVEPLRKAYAYAEEAHKGQRRSTGEPYITHPLNVALILAEMRLDTETLQAALLHDVIEDTSVTYEDVNRLFGTTVAHLV